MIEISVIVCTYNRARFLAMALESLVQQSLPPHQYEIIVVDNVSTDETSEVVKKFQKKYPKHTIMLVYESQQGLGYARNAGMKHAHGKYIAYLDDDACASIDWLKTALEFFENVRPTPICLGGPIFPFYSSPKPKWFKDEYEIRTWGEQPRFIKPGESFSGSNMFFRKEILEAYGGFDVSVGARGRYLSVGEETALFEKIWQAKNEATAIYYSPKLVTFHAVSEYKMTISYRLKRYFATGQAWHIIHGPKSLRGRLQLLPRILISFVFRSGIALMRIRKHRTRQNWIVEDFAPIVASLGILFGCVGLFIQVRQR